MYKKLLLLLNTGILLYSNAKIQLKIYLIKIIVNDTSFLDFPSLWSLPLTLLTVHCVQASFSQLYECEQHYLSSHQYACATCRKSFPREQQRETDPPYTCTLVEKCTVSFLLKLKGRVETHWPPIWFKLPAQGTHWFSELFFELWSDLYTLLNSKS